MIILKMRLDTEPAETPAERHQTLEGDARQILAEVKKGVSKIGSGRVAGQIVGDIRSAVDKAMTDAKAEIAGATTELVAEIRDGAKAVKSAINQEIATVRKQFGEIVGNAAAAAEEAVEEVRAEAGPAKTEGH